LCAGMFVVWCNRGVVVVMALELSVGLCVSSIASGSACVSLVVIAVGGAVGRGLVCRRGVCGCVEWREMGL